MGGPEGSERSDSSRCSRIFEADVGVEGDDSLSSIHQFEIRSKDVIRVFPPLCRLTGIDTLFDGRFSDCNISTTCSTRVNS